VFLVVCVPLVLLLNSCSGDPPSVLEPAGPAAERVERLWWPMLWISVVVFVIVAGMMVVAIVKARARSDLSLSRKHIGWGEPFIAIAGVFIPALILGGVYIFSLQEMNGLAAGGKDAEFTIQVSARDWWWEARYPNGAVTANEIHIPVGEPVRLELTSRDVIHSFWVPELQVKTDQIPGRTNYSWLQADAPGRYRGQCAEFCGLQHANMVFYVVAEPSEEFERWVDNEAADSAGATSNLAAEGEEIFMTSTCAGCHTIRGTTATEQLGPDLTHVATRETLAGTLPNTTEDLRLFVRDPQRAKPGAAMPPTELSATELDALVAYLEGLD
jgi:cytochrome c oxidase subunit II